MAELCYTVPPAFDGDTMQNFLRRDCGLSWRMVVKLKRVERGITLDGVPVRTIDRIKAGQTVRLRMPEDTVRIDAVDMPLAVVWEDDNLLVVNKPPYLAVHPSAGLPDPTLANAVVGYYRRRGGTLVPTGQPAGSQHQRAVAGGQKRPRNLCTGGQGA